MRGAFPRPKKKKIGAAPGLVGLAGHRFIPPHNTYGLDGKKVCLVTA